MKVVRKTDKEWALKKGYQKKILLEGKDLNYPGSLVQKIKIKAGEEVKEHIHKKQTEIFYFLTESSGWIINDKNMDFSAGDMLVLKPFDKHAVLNQSKKDFEFLVFKLNYEPEDLYWM